MDKPPSETDHAYLAGLFDADGSINVFVTVGSKGRPLPIG